MKNIILLLATVVLFTSCSKDEVTIEDCLKQNKKYKIEKVLNYRTGETVEKVICIER